MSPVLLILLIALQVIIFGGLIYAFRRIFSYNVLSATKHLEVLSQDFNQKQEILKKKLEEAERIYQEKLIDAQDVANQVKAKAVTEAQQEKDKIIQQARKQGEDIVQQADKTSQLLAAELDERVKRESIVYAVELIQHVIPARLREETHSREVADLIEIGLRQLDNLQVSGDVTEIRITSAFALTDKERSAIQNKLRERIKREINFKEEVNPQLVAGVVVNIGSLVIDGSLKYKVQEAAKKEILKSQSK